MRLEDEEKEIDNSKLRVEDGKSRFEDFILPNKQSIYIFLVIICRKTRHFEDIVNL